MFVSQCSPKKRLPHKLCVVYFDEMFSFVLICSLIPQHFQPCFVCEFEASPFAFFTHLKIPFKKLGLHDKDNKEATCIAQNDESYRLVPASQERSRYIKNTDVASLHFQQSRKITLI